MSEMKDLSPAEFGKSMRAHPQAVLLDVRTPEEFEEGHLPGALNIDIRGYDFHEQVEILDQFLRVQRKEKRKKIYVFDNMN